MVALAQEQSVHSWTTRRDEKKRRMQLVSPWMTGPVLKQPIESSSKAITKSKPTFSRDLWLKAIPRSCMTCI